MNMSSENTVRISVKHLRQFIKEALEDECSMDETDELDEVAPEGWEGTVRSMKKHKEIDNPWALSQWMKKKGYHHHK